MSVDEMIAQLDELDEDDRRRLRAALDRLQAAAGESEEERWRRGDEALSRLMRGVGKAGGKCLSEGIDEALYRGDR